MPNEPYVISPDDYGENDNYTQISLVYYAGRRSSLPTMKMKSSRISRTLLARTFAEHFGEYEKDCVCVRNDRLKTDYEICRDLMEYSTLLSRPDYRN